MRGSGERGGDGEVGGGEERLGGGKGEGRRRGKRMGHFTDGYDEMPGWTRRRGQRGGGYREEGNREGETGRERKEVVQA